MVSGVDPVVGMVVGVVFILELLEVAPPFTIITCTDYEGPTSKIIACRRGAHLLLFTKGKKRLRRGL